MKKVGQKLQRRLIASYNSSLKPYNHMTNYKKFEVKKLIKSFGHALDGVVYLLSNEQNARIHTIITILVGIGAYVFQVTRIEAAILFIAVILVFAIEIINTAIEKVFDLLHPGDHEIIRAVKDAMAGAVLISSIIAFVVAALVFLPHIKALV